MSLVGNLEDLGLSEILQILSLSRKSGTLSLCSEGREAAIVFRQGLVVRASSTMFPQSLGELLTRKSVIDPVILRKALSLQQAQGFLERLGAILVKNFGVNRELIEEVVREQIENVVISLFEWTSGSYDFQIQEYVEMAYDTKMDPLQFMLDNGINPQYLALEGERLFDERHQAISMGAFGGVSENDSGSAVAVRNQPATRRVPVANKSLVIVDDDGPTLQALASGLREQGFEVHAMSRSEDALVKIDGLVRSGERPTVLLDLIMPRMDGSGVLGGIELLELLHNNFEELPMIVMTDYHYADAEIKVHERGCSFLIKPRRAEVKKPELLNDFLVRLLSEIRLVEEVEPAPECPEKFNLGDELRLEMADSGAPAAAEYADAGPSSLLHGMLEELNSPELQGGVLLLLLRFASEFMNRAIVFAVNDRVVSGVGQFGISDGKVSGDDKVRAINFPLESGSMFSGPAQSGQASIFRPLSTPVDMHIFDQLGGGVPDEIFVGPIAGKSRLIGFLYGDNLPDDAPLTGTENLEIFLSKAGAALEKSMLERQIGERAGR